MLSASLFAPLLLAATLAGPPSAPDGLVLVTIDTLRADHVGPERTPAIDRLASRGVTFESAYAPAPSTAPSHVSLFTGHYPSFHGTGRYNLRYRLPPGTETLATRFREAGFATSAVISNPMLARGLGLEAGFERFDDRFESREANRPMAERRVDAAVAAALAELDRLAGEGPFFLWLHLQDPHGPYTASEGPMDPAAEKGDLLLPLGEDNSGDHAIPRYQRLGDHRRASYYRTQYRNEIFFLDEHLEPLLRRLREEERFGRTLVALTADHGEALGEDGYYFAHGHGVGPELTRVPLILAGRELPSARRIAGAVSTVSLFATLLEVFGLEPGPHQASSLLQLAATGRDPRPRLVFCESHNQVAIARGSAFLRRDRIETQEGDFWAGRNPDTGGAWRPLPALYRGATEDREELELLLGRFDEQALAANRRAEAERLERFGGPDPATLSSLGYLK